MSIVLERLVKRYGRHLVVNNVSLEVADGEFFVLLGPSGSGKTTILRMIAGLAEIEQGSVQLHGRDVTPLSPQHRGVGFVFQNYALFRHMSVAMNVEFALRIRKLAPRAREKRGEELLELVGLAGFGDRMPSQLSGGQQQRVALARALASEPEVLLLDEPFGALDARIRTDLRRTVRRIQQEMRIATIFVTHDQEEAFELADRMGVMNFGRLLEIGTPRELYLHPQTEFVATFLGTANLIVGERTPQGVRAGSVEFPLAPETTLPADPQRVQVLFRPEDVAVKTSAEALHWPLLGQAVVEEAEFSGSFERIRLRLPRIEGVRPISPPVPFGSDSFLVEATRSQHQSREFPLRPGDAAWVGVRRVHALTHPGLSFLLVDDGSEVARAAVELGSQIAQLAHARVMLLACGRGATAGSEALEHPRQRIGAGFAALERRQVSVAAEEAIPEETVREQYDLVVVGRGRDATRPNGRDRVAVRCAFAAPRLAPRRSTRPRPRLRRARRAREAGRPVRRAAHPAPRCRSDHPDRAAAGSGCTRDRAGRALPRRRPEDVLAPRRDLRARVRQGVARDELRAEIGEGEPRSASSSARRCRIAAGR